MPPLPFEQARRTVIERVRPCRPEVEWVDLADAADRVLAADIRADRPYPPLPRSIRDGFAIRSCDVPGDLHIVGEVRAGQSPDLRLQAGQAIEIMTGAGVPEGADAVVMIEHVAAKDGIVSVSRPASPGDFIVPAGSECGADSTALEAGRRIDFAHVAALASVGCVRVPVFRRPVVAILATGDEIVEVRESPLPHQIRNSNSHSLAAQVRRAGGEPRILRVARDNYDSTRSLIEEGLACDLLLLSGGVSAGKYDIVEQVLADLGAEFFFDRVLIQPGQPLVFGAVRGRFFFGLPGNPASTMVTFEVFARTAVELLGGISEPSLPFVFARLRSEFRHKPGLTRFLPAKIGQCGCEVAPVEWQGSGDVFALARANAFLVAREDREVWPAGDLIEVLQR